MNLDGNSLELVAVIVWRIIDPSLRVQDIALNAEDSLVTWDQKFQDESEISIGLIALNRPGDTLHRVLEYLPLRCSRQWPEIDALGFRNGIGDLAVDETVDYLSL